MLAGGASGTALRLGLAMLAIQLSIGAFNDLNDAAADALTKASKPIPAGLARPTDARFLTAAGLLVGVALSWPSGPLVAAIAIAGAACGYVYDAWLKRTAWSWLPLALALPLLPAYAWLGASASPSAAFGAGLPAWALIVVPLALAAGGAVAISNALVDLEADRAAGLATVVARLGPSRSWWLHAGLMASVVIVAFAALLGSRASGAGVVAFAAGSALIVVGLWLTRRPGPGGVGVGRGLPGLLTRRAWEVETVGLGLLGLGWVAAMASVGA